MNERLRSALQQSGLSIEALANHCGANPKTVERWISEAARIPHRHHREAAAGKLGVSTEYLWPGSSGEERHVAAMSAHTEILGTYPDRSSVPRAVWLQLLQSANEKIDILVFSGTFLAQTNPRIAGMLLERAADGVEVRLCFGDPSGSAVAQRDEEEGIQGTLGAKIRASRSYFAELVEASNCDVRLHNTTLYASIFRYDDQAMINPHIWGQPASANPLLHVRDVGVDGMFHQYLSSFDRIWQRAGQWLPGKNGENR